MDSVQTPNSSPDPTTTRPQDEVDRITQALYKQNFELKQKNKTLTLLHKIDDIILSTVTDIKLVAQQVADVVVSEHQSNAVVILLFDKDNKKLTRLAVSSSPPIQSIEEALKKPFYPDTTFIEQPDSFLAKAVYFKTGALTENLSDILQPSFTAEEIKMVSATNQIKTSFIEPLIVREETIGVLIMCLDQTQEQLLQYQPDLLQRLINGIGIAIYNALSYQTIQTDNERLKELDKLKDNFVTLASHELRTPLSGIKSQLWLLLQQRPDIGTLNDKQKQYMEQTYQATDQLIRLVHDMLNISRIESGRITIKTQPTHIDQLTQEVVTELTPLAQSKHLTFTITPSSSPLPAVLADPNMIKEVLTNLIGNSINFTPSEGKITISFSFQDEKVTTAIADTGIGIKQEDLPKLFQKFDMIEERYGSDQAFQGTGIGLYIAKSIIGLHGGTLSVASEGENKGTTFSFTLSKA